MAAIDYPYLCAAISRLSSVPIRIYEGGEVRFFCSVMSLPVDPIRPYKERILAEGGHVGYFITEDFDFYGIVHAGGTAIVLGPSRQIPRTAAQLGRLAFDLGVDKADVKQFTTSMGAILPLPLDFLLEILCMVNYMVCGEKLQAAEVRLTDLEQAAPGRPAQEQPQGPDEEAAVGGKADVYNAYRIEQELLSIVRRGDVQQLEEWAAHAPAVRPGQIAMDTLRQEKNIYTVTTTLVSRAAIQGGMDVEDAMRLSDSLIKKCELATSLDAIAGLRLRMARNYTAQVAHIQGCGARCELAAKVVSYVRRHLSEPIRTQDIAKALYLGRSHLSTRFKKEQGSTLADFIQQVKINEAKHLLRHTRRSLLDISDYLGFSSQSHFTRVFKAQTGRTPGEYRAG